jgi:hypothetical protein
MKNHDKITNRHVGKLLARLEFLDLPEIALSDIARQMHFLKKDLISETKKLSGENQNEEINYNR